MSWTWNDSRATCHLNILYIFIVIFKKSLLDGKRTKILVSQLPRKMKAMCLSRKIFLRSLCGMVKFTHFKHSSHFLSSARQIRNCRHTERCLWGITLSMQKLSKAFLLCIAKPIMYIYSVPYSYICDITVSYVALEKIQED